MNSVKSGKLSNNTANTAVAYIEQKTANDMFEKYCVIFNNKYGSSSKAYLFKYHIKICPSVEGKIHL
jgi:hypothetical protein